MQSAPSQLLADRWQLIEFLGQGAMGEVWRGRHATLGHEVAIKLMRPEAATDEELVARFRREARIAAQLRHRNLVRVEDLGTAPDGRPFLVMELLRGESLAKMLERTHRVDSHTAVRVVSHIAAACDVAHAAGIVHRDLKPDNCFVVIDEDGAPLVKVLDFGVAKVADGMFKTTAGALTGTHALLGTPIYMSPEQARGQADLDGRSDLWSLGIIAYELLTGRLPYQASNLSQLLFAVLSASIPPPSAYDASIGPQVDAWFAQALDRDRTRRFQNGREFSASLARALGVAWNSLTPPAIPRGHELPVSGIGPTAASLPLSLAPHAPAPMSPATMTAPTSEIGAIDTRRAPQPSAPPNAPASMRPPPIYSSPPPPMAGAVYNAVAATAYANPSIPSAPSLPRTEAIPMPAVMPPGGLGYAPSAPHAPAHAPAHAPFASPHGGSGFGPVPHVTPVAAPPFHAAHPHAMNHPGYAMQPQPSSSSNRLMVVTLALGIVAGMLVTGTIVMVQRRKNHRAQTANATLVQPPAATPYYPSSPQLAAPANTTAAPTAPAVDDAGAHAVPSHVPTVAPVHPAGTASPGVHGAHGSDPGSETATDAGTARAGSGWSSPHENDDDPPTPSADPHRGNGTSTGATHTGHADPPGGEQQFEGP